MGPPALHFMQEFCVANRSPDYSPSMSLGNLVYCHRRVEGYEKWALRLLSQEANVRPEDTVLQRAGSFLVNDYHPVSVAVECPSCYRARFCDHFLKHSRTLRSWLRSACANPAVR